MIIVPFEENYLYETLVSDICGTEYPKYDNMVIFVHNLLNPLVESLCRNTSALCGGLHEEDVMQEIQIKIIKNCENYFFKPINGKTEKTCADFKAWCVRVAKNYFFTYCVKQKSRKEVELDLSRTGEDTSFIDTHPLDIQETVCESRKRIRDCFLVVLDLKSKPHIILTWLSASLFIMGYDENRIESTHLLVERFSELTLTEMMNIIVNLIEKFSWLQIDEGQLDKQREKLKKIDKGTGKKIGDMKYSDFYMNKGPEMSVSDWINRVNSQIKKRMSDD